MTPTRTLKAKAPLALLALIAVQSFCAAFYVLDAISDYRSANPADGPPFHLSVEGLATVALVAAVAVEINLLRGMLRRQERLEKRLHLARAAVEEVIGDLFAAWDLSPSERDVATFLVKGLGISEIAALRGNAEGTVKAHLNAIYRKSGTRNRGELLSLVIDTLMAAGDDAPARPYPREYIPS